MRDQYLAEIAELEAQHGPNDPRVVAALFRLAIWLVKNRIYSQGEPYFARSVEIQQQSVADDKDAVLVSMLDEWTAWALRKRDLKTAEPYFLMSIAVKERVSGAENFEVIAALDAWVDEAMRKSDLDAAEPYFLKSLAARERAFGPESPEVLTTLDGIAKHYLGQMRSKKALAMEMRALAIAEKIEGSATRGVAGRLVGIAWLLIGERTGEALEVLERALAIYDILPSVAQETETAAALDCLVEALTHAGRFDDAKLHMLRSLNLKRSAFASEPERLVQKFEMLVDAYRSRGRLVEGVDLLIDGIGMTESDAPEAVVMLLNLAELFAGEGHPGNATATAWLCLNSLKRLLSLEGEDLLEAMRELPSESQRLGLLERLRRLLDMDFSHTKPGWAPDPPVVASFWNKGRPAGVHPRGKREAGILDEEEGEPSRAVPDEEAPRTRIVRAVEAERVMPAISGVLTEQQSSATLYTGTSRPIYSQRDDERTRIVRGGAAPTLPVEPVRSETVRSSDGWETEQGKLLERIPRKMVMGERYPIEVRLGRDGIPSATMAASMPGPGEISEHALDIVDAMSVEISSPEGAFEIDGASPIRQIVKRDREPGNERQFGSQWGRWIWYVTPTRRGIHPLCIHVSAAVVDRRGVPAETLLPDREIPVAVLIGVTRTAGSLLWQGVTLASGAVVTGIAGGVVGGATKDIWWPRLRDFLHAAGFF